MYRTIKAYDSEFNTHWMTDEKWEKTAWFDIFSHFSSVIQCVLNSESYALTVLYIGGNDSACLTLSFWQIGHDLMISFTVFRVTASPRYTSKAYLQKVIDQYGRATAAGPKLLWKASDDWRQGWLLFIFIRIRMTYCKYNAWYTCTYTYYNNILISLANTNTSILS